MTNRQGKLLIIGVAVFLLLSGVGLYLLFEKQGFSKKETYTIASYDVKDYIETYPIVNNSYGDIYNSINVSIVGIKNIDNNKKNDFINKENELIGYIDGYYSEIKAKIKDDYVPVNKVSSNIKTQVNGTVLSVFYELDFDLDSNYFSSAKRKYITTYNYDLVADKILNNDNLLDKYNYTKRYLSEKIFEEDILMAANEVVIDKETNISLTGREVEKRKERYVERINAEFDNIINMYIENGSLILTYNKRELKELFFDNEYFDEIIFRSLQ